MTREEMIELMKQGRYFQGIGGDVLGANYNGKSNLMWMTIDESIVVQTQYPTKEHRVEAAQIIESQWRLVPQIAEKLEIEVTVYTTKGSSVHKVPASVKIRELWGNEKQTYVKPDDESVFNGVGSMFDGNYAEYQGQVIRIMDRIESQEVYDILSR